VTLFTRPQFQRDVNGYIKVPVTPSMQQVARQKSATLGSLKNSIRKGGGNIIGYLGQLAAEKAIIGMKREDTYDYDLVCDGIRYDVKSKDRTAFPLPHYEVSIADSNTTQATDYYIFASGYRLVGTFDYKMIYILGYMTQSEYLHKAHFLRKGDIDTSNNFTVSADCYNLPASELRGFD